MTTDTSFKPDYVPPHLQGRVSDFRREPGGGVSFFDPRAALGTFGPEASRTTVDQKVYDHTFGNSRFDLDAAFKNQYGLSKEPETYATMARDWLVEKGRKGLDYGLSSQGKATGTVGLLGALAGGVAGFRGENGSVGKGLLYALLAGGTAAGATALGQNLHGNSEMLREKAASVTKSAFADSDLLSLITQSIHIPDQQKNTLVAACSRLRSHEKNELSSLIRVSAGAAVGALIMRYLRGKGLLGMAVGGMLGAFVGRATAPQPIYNRFGQLSVTNFYS